MSRGETSITATPIGAGRSYDGYWQASNPGAAYGAAGPATFGLERAGNSGAAPFLVLGTAPTWNVGNDPEATGAGCLVFAPGAGTVAAAVGWAPVLRSPVNSVAPFNGNRAADVYRLIATMQRPTAGAGDGAELCISATGATSLSPYNNVPVSGCGIIYRAGLGVRFYSRPANGGGLAQELTLVDASQWTEWMQWELRLIAATSNAPATLAVLLNGRQLYAVAFDGGVTLPPYRGFAAYQPKLIPGASGVHLQSLRNVVGPFGPGVFD